MGGELLAPTGWARVHPLQRAALCLKGTRLSSRLIPGWGSTPLPTPQPPATQSKSGQGGLWRWQSAPRALRQTDPWANSAPDASRDFGE